MEQFSQFINYSLFTIYDHTYTVGQVLIIPCALMIGHFLIRKVRNMLVSRMRKMEHDKDFILLFDRLFMVVSYVMLTMLILSLMKIPLTAFAFVSGALAIGLGFGAQNIVNNFISGWILMWERPIRIGDFLEIGDVKGSVETINTRSTRIRRVDGVHMLVPNSQLLENTVVNWTLIDRQARGVVRVGVAYGSLLRKVEECIYKAVSEHDDIIKEPAPLVIFEDFGDSALVFDVYFWINAFGEKDLRRIKSDIRFRIDELFAQNGIVIAFPQRDIHVDGQLKLVGENAPQANVAAARDTSLESLTADSSGFGQDAAIPASVTRERESD